MDNDQATGSTCPVCGWTGLSADWAPGCRDICDCCGTQFGLDDMPDSPAVRVRRISPDGVVEGEREALSSSPLQTQQAMWAHLRLQWVRAGMRWWNGSPPEGWDPREQLRSIDGVI